MKRSLLLAILFWSALCYSQTTIEFSTQMPSEIENQAQHSSVDWGLTIDEWSRFENLEQQYSGLVSSEISPLEWLGIFADSPTDRKRYAEMLANRQMKVLDSIAKFESAYINAIQTLIARKGSSQVGKRIMLVTPFACEQESCRKNLSEALQHAQNGGTVNIYIQEPTTEAQMRYWLAVHRIPLQLIRDRRISVSNLNSINSDLHSGIFPQN